MRARSIHLRSYSRESSFALNHVYASGALPIRILLPPTLFLLSSPYFLPKTASNVRAYASSLEDTYFPSLGAQHAALNKTVANSSMELRTALRAGFHKAEKAIEEGLKKAEEWSGLKLNAGGKK